MRGIPDVNKLSLEDELLLATDDAHGEVQTRRFLNRDLLGQWPHRVEPDPRYVEAGKRFVARELKARRFRDLRYAAQMFGSCLGSCLRGDWRTGRYRLSLVFGHIANWLSPGPDDFQ